MKKLTTALALTFFFLNACSQSKNSIDQQLNLGFEQQYRNFPSKWTGVGDKDYLIAVDSVHKKSGKLSAVIENKGTKTNFRAISIKLPHNYEGKSIRLTGYVKTENVTQGYAGLWIKIDPQIGSDNMSDRGLKGTNDWTACEVTLPLDAKGTDQIVLGGLLVGHGKMWLDDLKITIDGMELDDPKLKIHIKEVLPSQADKAFDRGSGINFPNLDETQIKNLELLGKIWGLMKYHHPAIAKGNYNWDYELFRFLPNYLKVNTNEQRDSLLNKWTAKYGEVPACKTCKPIAADAVLKPELSWIDNANLSASLKQSLKHIYNNRHQGKQYYIGLDPGVGNPNFTNENAYTQFTYPDAGFRLLSLYRYWNMIQYFFPNRQLTDKNWNTVLKVYLKDFINAKDELAYELAALQLIGEVNDTHANLWGGGDKIAELRGNNFAPFKTAFVENQLVVTAYFNPEFSETAKLKVGDIITHINGRTVSSLVDSLKAYYPASNSAAMLRDMSADLLRSADKTIRVDYISEKSKLQQLVPTYDRKNLNIYRWKVNKSEKCYKLLEGNIGYITLGNIKKEDITEIKKLFKQTKGIIIDIRNYPSTFVPFLLGSYFMTAPTPFVKFKMGNPDHPGEFIFRDGPKITSDNNKYQGKLVILVNENSQSQSEYTAMAFRAVKNATVVGSTTAGADGNVSDIRLPGGLSTMISGIGVFYPNGKDTQRIGILPDIWVQPTIKGIKQGKDEVLDSAIKIIND